ncbi:MAG TPA: hypothetical protein VKQ89_03995 [Candidatus Angelobacter sp.]|nr:hypothetical protein [Candidatus Angelobacter sp.]
MLNVLRDFLLSFCPAAVRRAVPPESSVQTLRSATWSGLAQFSLAAFLLLVRFKGYFVLRAQEYGPHIGGTTEVVEAGIAVFIALEYLAHPLSLLLLYLTIEGLARFAGGLIAGEVLPSFLVFLAFKTAQFAKRVRQRRQKAALPPDTLETMPDRRLRIACAQPRERWNSSITIAVHGAWFEVESSEAGPPPRPFVYTLRSAPAGKVLRGYEEYDVASAVTAAPVRPVGATSAGQSAEVEK